MEPEPAQENRQDMEELLEVLRISMRKISMTQFEDLGSFDCPICLNMVMPPIHVVCENQHIVCNDCLPELFLKNNNCPNCRGQILGPRRSFTAEDTLQKLLCPKFCQFRCYGCRFSIDTKLSDKLQNEQLTEHEQNCQFSWDKMQTDLKVIHNELDTMSLGLQLKDVKL